ncbi:alpha-N-acetylglucosaminidase N-terminal domain-containing protein [Wocania ichthyoenteri]
MSGSNQVSMASGLNWYLRYYCHVLDLQFKFITVYTTR